MTLKEFQDIRADISHGLLENGVFFRLGATSRLLESDASVAQRAAKLAECSVALLNERANFARAAATWLKGDSGMRSVREEVDGLLTAAETIEGLAPNSQFPKHDTVLRHIDRCSVKLEDLPRLYSLLKHDQPVWLQGFWIEALETYDVVRGLRKGSPQFWEVFRSTK